MKNKFLKITLGIVMMVVSFATFSSASSNISGIWAGEVNSTWLGPDANYKDDIYLSIHQTLDNIFIVILSSVEATSDLFSSTYLGDDLNNLESFGDYAYFPDFNPVDQSLSYVNTASPIFVTIFEDGQSGTISNNCDTTPSTCSVFSVIIIRKIL